MAGAEDWKLIDTLSDQLFFDQCGQRLDDMLPWLVVFAWEAEQRSFGWQETIL
tara:strand:- start:32377 stop:32535 length:159 start_codon:yes stop_codon:yes gene_type:complete